jgi:hypothetical protein
LRRRIARLLTAKDKRISKQQRLHPTADDSRGIAWK